MADVLEHGRLPQGSAERLKYELWVTTLYRADWSIRRIARALKLSYGLTHRLVSESGIPLRARGGKRLTRGWKPSSTAFGERRPTPHLDERAEAQRIIAEAMDKEDRHGASVQGRADGLT